MTYIYNIIINIVNLYHFIHIMNSPINWFPELLPKEQLLMESWIDKVKNIYKLYWYIPIETASVESLDTLLTKWSDDKEIYGVGRYNDISSEENEHKKPKLGLHFDLTVPFARYTVDNFHNLTFPFKRYQIQKCRRWERPQMWRYREFLQTDIDVIGIETLPLHYDAEVLEMWVKALNTIIPDQFYIYINNRKLIDWICNFYHIDGSSKQLFLNIVDKLDKIWSEQCRQELERINIPTSVIDLFINNWDIDFDSQSLSKIFEIYQGDITINNAINEIQEIMSNVSNDISHCIKFKINMVRWLWYYTGTIFEWKLKTLWNISICWWGRYDNLTNMISWKRLPGVWFSLWLTRLFWLLNHLQQINTENLFNTQLMIWWYSESQRNTANNIANILRNNFISCEIIPNFNKKIWNQFKFSEKRGINNFLILNNGTDMYLKDLKNWDQIQVTMENLFNTLSHNDK